MLWFLGLHIIAVMCWCAAQLYLPALIAVSGGEHKNRTTVLGSTGVTPTSSALKPGLPQLLPRFVFTRIATPAALIAIVSGTVIFVLNRTLEIWFIVKLSLVAALVITHTLTGWLLLHAEARPGPRVVLASRVLGAALAVLMTAIVWVVLAKPLPDLLQ